MSSKEKSTAAIRKEDSKKEDNLKKGKELTESTTIILKKIMDEKKEMKYEIINSSTDIQIINESQFDIEIKKRNYK